MVYPYENLRWPPPSFSKPSPISSERWQGTVYDAVVELGQLASGAYQPNKDAVWDEVAWHPARIMAAVIAATNDNTPRVAELTEIVTVAKSVFRGTATNEDIMAIEDTVADYALTAKDACLWIDDATLAATSPLLCRAAASRLHERYPERLSMLALGNGGFTAGIVTALEYETVTGQELPIYPIRFSTRKNHDRTPRINTDELEYIGNIDTKRTVVVSDEDSTSGETIGKAILHFRTLFPDHTFVGLANADRRNMYGENHQQIQGLWWEHFESR